MNRANIQPYMVLKLNVRSLSLASEMNGRNIQLHMTLNKNVGSFFLASEMNGANIHPRNGIYFSIINFGPLMQTPIINFSIIHVYGAEYYCYSFPNTEANTLHIFQHYTAPKITVIHFQM